MDGSFLAVLFAVLISAFGIENGIFIGVVLLFLYYPLRYVLFPFVSLKADEMWFYALLFDDDYLLSRDETLTKKTRKALPINWPTYSFFYLTFVPPNGDENTTQHVTHLKSVSGGQNHPPPSIRQTESAEKDTRVDDVEEAVL